ncbi:MAG: VOC family protein [Pseudomonadota bacterium]
MLESNAFNWVTIPVSDMERAMGFYGQVFDLTLEATEMPGGEQLAFLPRDQEGHGAPGALWKGDSPTGFKPGDAGPEPIFGCAVGLENALSRVEKAGGKVLSDKTSMGENGFIAHVLDTEGNRIGLHSYV